MLYVMLRFAGGLNATVLTLLLSLRVLTVNPCTRAGRTAHNSAQPFLQLNITSIITELIQYRIPPFTSLGL